jgi:hypothetical protein
MDTWPSRAAYPGPTEGVDNDVSLELSEGIVVVVVAVFLDFT